jgi:hypothetical protein
LSLSCIVFTPFSFVPKTHFSYLSNFVDTPSFHHLFSAVNK